MLSNGHQYGNMLFHQNGPTAFYGATKWCGTECKAWYLHQNMVLMSEARAICPQVWSHQDNFWVWRWRRQSKMPDILWHVEPKQVAALYNSDMGSHLSRVLILQRHQHLQFASTRHLIGILLDPQQLDTIFDYHRLFLILLPWLCWHLLGHWWHKIQRLCIAKTNRPLLWSGSQFACNDTLLEAISWQRRCQLSWNSLALEDHSVCTYVMQLVRCNICWVEHVAK